MEYIKRYLVDQVQKDLHKKMVFIGGARQVGKTTLAKTLLGESQQGYLNWDIHQHRSLILEDRLPVAPLWVFDEIHKYQGWRNYLKGLYDQFPEHPLLATGSARLDYYRFGGDSLQGRYFYLRMHPLSVAELGITTAGDFEHLLNMGGFPEPFFSGSSVDAKRWSRAYRERLIQEDLSSLEAVKDVGRLELLMLRLPQLVGSPLSINALREDLQVGHDTVTRWMTWFERLYAIFRIPPYNPPSLLRAVKKEQKHYHTDWNLVQDIGPRFENLVACHLLKWVHYLQDTQGRDVELRYFKDIDGREVDFLIVEHGQPTLAIECKTSGREVSKHLRYFKTRFPKCDAWQLTTLGEEDYLSKDGIRVSPAWVLLKDFI